MGPRRITVTIYEWFILLNGGDVARIGACPNDTELWKIEKWGKAHTTNESKRDHDAVR